MDSNFIFVAIALTIIFIVLDIEIYSYRKKWQNSDSMAFSITFFRKFVNEIFSKITGALSVKRTKPEENNPQNPKPIENLETEKDDFEIVSSSNFKNNQTTVFADTPSITSQEKLPEQDKDMSDRLVHVQISADIPEGTVVYITLNVESGQAKTTIHKSQFSSKSNSSPSHQTKLKLDPGSGKPIHALRQFFETLSGYWKRMINNPEKVLLLAAILTYALVVTIGIDRYPIYFFTDEAAHMNLAANFLRDGFKNYFGEFLPTFFTTEGWVNGTSVYVQVLPFILFGKSVIVTRLVSAFFSLLGAIAVSLLLKDALKLKYYWAGVFVVLTTPAWFLHARTTFEYVEVASFYSIFLYFYSRYRAGHLKSLYWAMIAGALAFYTHGLGQFLIGISGLIFFVVDFRYHTHPDQKKTVQNALIIGVVLLLPFLRYYIAHPGEAAEQVKRRGSYWSDSNFSFPQKLGELFKAYSYGLNPEYWFFKNNVDLNRHTMKDYGNGLLITLPFWVIGLVQTIKNIRLPSYRIILISLLVCPIPASVVAIGMPRMLWVTIPAALVTTIGIVAVLGWIESRWHLRSSLISIGLFIILAGLSAYMLRDALVNGPTWYEDYSLYGMQYGAQQVFKDVVLSGLEQDPSRQYIVSPSWANGTEQFVDFFIPQTFQSRIKMGQPIDFIPAIQENTPNLYFVATSAEYDKLIINPEFININVTEVLNFPNNKPGFYVFTLQASPNIKEILDTQHKKNQLPIEDILSIKGVSFRVLHSPLGSGRLDDVFDNNPDSLARVLEANPFLLDLYPATPIDTNSFVIQTGSLNTFTIKIQLYADENSEPVIYEQTFTNLPPDPKVEINFSKGPAQSERITIEIHDDTSGDTSQIHVRSIEFK